LVVAGIVIAFAPRLTVNRCAYAGITGSDEEAIVWLINAEGEAVVSENLGLIKKIFAADAIFVDMLTQEKWFSPVARYTHLIDAADYTTASHADINRAFFTSGSSGAYMANGIKSSYSTKPDSDHWTLEKQRGCWVITKFEFNASGIKFP
jgi:hypothetical protein